MGVAVGGTASRGGLWWGGMALAIVFLGWNFFNIYYVGSYAWDDGAITLAYARTVAENGVFALNSVSERVEGSSSLLFLFTMAALHAIFDFGFDGIIQASQCLTFVFVLATLGLLYRELSSAIPDAQERLVLTLLFGLLPVFTTESMNGMEMSLTAFLFLCLYSSFRSGSYWIYLLIPLLLLSRFESVFYLIFAFGLYFLFQKGDRQRGLLLALYTFGLFCFVSLGRWLYFGELVPNTVWAKMNPPYSIVGSPLDKLLNKSAGLGEFLQVTAMLSVPAVVLALLRWRKSGRLDIAALVIVAFAAFALISGKNWGYDGRMFIASMPLMLLVLAASLASPEIRGAAFMPAWLRCSARPAGRSGIFWLLLALLLCATVINRPLTTFNLRATLHAAYWRDMLSPGLREQVEKRWLAKSPYPPGWYGPSPENFRQTSLAVDRLRTTLGMESVVYMVPDVGGSSLCCDRLNIIDIGLLTNAHMAKKGYSDFFAYLEKTNPDVIQTHTVWATNSRIYESGFFQANYKPVILQNNWLWLRADRHAQLLRAVPAAELSRSTIPVDHRSVRYGPAGSDLPYPMSLPDKQVLTWNPRP